MRKLFRKAPLDAAVDAAYSSTAHSFDSELENAGFSYALFAGYSFNKYLAIEAATPSSRMPSTTSWECGRRVSVSDITSSQSPTGCPFA